MKSGDGLKRTEAWIMRSQNRRGTKEGQANCLCAALVTLWFLTASPSALAQSRPGFDSVEIDALDPDAWNGVVFLAKAFQQPAHFALRVGSRGSNYLVGKDLFNAVREIGPHAPDASYCRLGWEQAPRENLVRLEWARVDQTTVVGRLTAAEDIQLVLETYFPFGSTSGHMGNQGQFSLAESNQAVIGERFFDNAFGPTAQFVVMVDRPTMGSGTFADSQQISDSMNATGRLVSRLIPLPAEPANVAAGLEFVTAESRPAHFVATLGWEKDLLITHARGWLTPGKIDSLLDKNSESYANRRPKVKGLFEGAPEAIGNNMFWSTIYVPPYNLVFPTDTRAWAHNFGGWVVFEWDNFFNALLTSLEDKAQTDAGIKAVLLGQTPAGFIPNCVSASATTPDRSQPPVGAYCVWKVYEKYQDRKLLQWAYLRLKTWHEWWLKDRGDGQSWRDGDGDGLLEWGSDRGSGESLAHRGISKAPKWESGMDDSPMYDDAGYDEHAYTMKMNDVGLNSLYALDAECLSKMAGILGKDEDSRQFAVEYERMKKLINAKLWNESDGIYENRHWNGEYSHRLSPTSFYPLFAGIATQEQAARMVQGHLLNPKEFWGKYVIPSISRDDPAFRDQYYWRGSIWGLTNYMVYQGLKRYKLDSTAFEFAQKSFDLFMDDWRVNQHDDEQYLASGGQAKGDPHYTFGALLPLIATEEYIDENPWDGLRFAILSPPSAGEFRGAMWEGHTYDITVGPQRTALFRDGHSRFEADAGVVVRKYQAESSRLSFSLTSERATRVTTTEFASGDFDLKIDGKTAGTLSVREGRISFEVPAGEHSIELGIG
jgi:hypothetical protein